MDHEHKRPRQGVCLKCKPKSLIERIKELEKQVQELEDRLNEHR